MQTLQRQHLPPRPSPPRFPWPRLERPPRRRSPSPARRRLRTAMKVNGTAAARPTPPMTTTQLQVNLQNSRAKSFSPDPSLFTIYLRSTSPKLSFKLKISESARRVVILDIRWSALCLSAFFFFLVLRHSSSLSCVKCWHFMILRGGNGNMKNSPSSFLFPVLLLLSHIIKNPQLCFSVRSRTEKVKKTKKPASSGFFSEFVSSAEFQSFELIPRGVLRTCRHLCGWERTLRPLTPLWLSHLSLAGGATAVDPIMDLMPGEAAICFPVYSSHLSSIRLSSSDLLTFPFCLFHFSPASLPSPLSSSTLKSSRSFTSGCTNKCAAPGLPDQRINSASGPIIHVSDSAGRSHREQWKATFMGVNGFFFFLAPVHKWDFSATPPGPDTTGLQRETLIDLFWNASAFLFFFPPIDHRARGPKRKRDEEKPNKPNVTTQTVILFTSRSTWRCVGTKCVRVVLWRSRLN